MTDQAPRSTAMPDKRPRVKGATPHIGPGGVVSKPWWLVLENPHAGPGTRGFDLFAEARYAQHHVGCPVQVWRLTGREDLATLLGQAITDGCRRVIVHGGDGTVRAVAGVLAGPSSLPASQGGVGQADPVTAPPAVTLAILPGGTFNHFARNLDVPGDLQAAWRVALTGRVQRVDVGTVNGEVFVNNASLGVYPQIVLSRPRWSGRLGRLMGGAVSLVKVLADFVAPRLTIFAAGRVVVDHTPVVFVGNNRYGGDPAELWRRPRLDQGLLDVHVWRGSLWAGLLWQTLTALGVDSPAKMVSEFVAADFEIRSGRLAVPVALDGEIVGLTLPLRFASRPAALAVVVP